MTCTIVFADEQRGIRRFCKQELEAAGYRVLLARDGEEALNLVKTFSVDLVILDEHLPRCCGPEAARHIKRWYPHISVIVFAADRDSEWLALPLADAAIAGAEDLTVLKAAIIDLLSDSPPSVIGSRAIQACEFSDARVAC